MLDFNYRVKVDRKIIESWFSEDLVLSEKLIKSLKVRNKFIYADKHRPLKSFSAEKESFTLKGNIILPRMFFVEAYAKLTFKNIVEILYNIMYIHEDTETYSYLANLNFYHDV